MSAPLISIDVSALERLISALKDLSAAQHERVIPRALNDVLDGAYTQVARNMAKETGAQQKRVRGVLVKRRASANHMQAEIVARDRFMSLKDFRPAQRKGGVSASPWGDRQIFKGTFIGPGGHVFKREGAKRLPIEMLWGPAIPRQLIKGKTEEIVNAVVNERFTRRLEYQIDRELNRVKAKYKV